MELTQSEQQKVKKVKKRKDTLRDLQENIKWTNIHITGFQGGGKSEKEHRSYLKLKSFLTWGRKQTIQMQETRRVISKMNAKKPKPRHIIIKMSKGKARTE